MLQNFKPIIYVTAADFEGLTHNGALCDAHGGIDADAFEAIMREQVCDGVTRRVRCDDA